MGKDWVKERRGVAIGNTYRMGDIVDPCHGTTISVQRKVVGAHDGALVCDICGRCLVMLSDRVRVSCRVVEQILVFFR